MFFWTELFNWDTDETDSFSSNFRNILSITNKHFIDKSSSRKSCKERFSRCLAVFLLQFSFPDDIAVEVLKMVRSPRFSQSEDISMERNRGEISFCCLFYSTYAPSRDFDKQIGRKQFGLQKIQLREIMSTSRRNFGDGRRGRCWRKITCVVFRLQGDDFNMSKSKLARREAVAESEQVSNGIIHTSTV